MGALPEFQELHDLLELLMLANDGLAWPGLARSGLAWPGLARAITKKHQILM